MITINSTEYNIIRTARDILARRRRELTDEELTVLNDLEFLIAKIWLTGEKQLKNSLYCRRYREKHSASVKEYNRNYYRKNHSKEGQV